MAKRRRPETYFEMIGNDFDSFMSPFDVTRRTKLFRQLWPQTNCQNSLEVGCGTGAITRGLRDLTCDLVVTDISRALAEKVASELDCSFKQADAMNLPFASGSFDLVFSSECIEHTPDPKRAIREMVRVTRSGGFILFSTPNKLWFPLVKFGQITRLRKFQGNEIFLWPGEITRELDSAGGTLIKHQGCHLLPWQIPVPRRWLAKLDEVSGRAHRLMINQVFLGEKR